MEGLLKQVEEKDAAKATEMRGALKALLEKYGYEQSQYWGRMIYGAINWPDHQKTVPNSQFDQDRKEIISMIMKCREILGQQ